MYIYTMGFTQKSAEQFFEKIKSNNIQVVVDVRLNNQSQLAGFSKGKDLSYFLKVICNCLYEHEIKFAPTKEILSSYKKGSISWEEYVIQFNNLIELRDMSTCYVCDKHGEERGLSYPGSGRPLRPGGLAWHLAPFCKVAAYCT